MSAYIQDLGLQVGNVSVQVIYGDRDITVHTKYPLRVGSAEMEDFSVQFPIRLKRIYQLAYRIVEQDALNVTFHKGIDFRNLKDCLYKQGSGNCWEPTMRVYNLRDVYKYDDVLRIEDEESSMGGEPYIFQVGIENRRPMLNYIYSSHNNTYANSFHLVGFAGEQLRIQPQGYDPDEDALYYNYSLWAETENTTFMDPGCPNTQNITCVLHAPGQPHRWTTSIHYNSPVSCHGRNVARQCAQIVLGDDDRGIHETRVSVSDDAGLYDFQIVKSLVDEP
jgi:hypothetical protein